MITLGLLLVIIKTGRTVAKTKCPPAARQVSTTQARHGLMGGKVLTQVETCSYESRQAGSDLLPRVVRWSSQASGSMCAAN